MGATRRARGDGWRERPLGREGCGEGREAEPVRLRIQSGPEADPEASAFDANARRCGRSWRPGSRPREGAMIQEWTVRALPKVSASRIGEPHTFEIPSEREDMAAVRDPHWWEATIQVVRAARSPGADAIPTNRGRPADPPQRIGGRCGSRASPDATGTSPTRSAPDEVTGDRKTNGSVPRQSRREAEPQRGLTGWAAALSRHTGVSRDQPLEVRRVQRGAWSQRGSPWAGPGAPRPRR